MLIEQECHIFHQRRKKTGDNVICGFNDVYSTGFVLLIAVDYESKRWCFQ